MDKIDDIGFIRKFVRGQTRLAFNNSLKIEPCSDTIQLLTKKGSLLATTKLVHHYKIFLVRENSVYWQIINQVMLENCMMPNGKNEHGLIKYQFTSIPISHKINYDITRIMWKNWRSHMVCKDKDGLPFHFFIATSQGWEPIIDMAFSQEIVFVTTNLEEKMLHISDKVVWLSPKTENPEDNLFSESLISNENYISASEILSDTLDKDTLLKGSIANPDETPTFVTYTSAETSDNSQDEIISTEFASMVAENNHNDSTVRTNNQNILSVYQGKLYIQTLEGEIVVEGYNMRFWFTPPEGSNIPPQAVNVK